MRRPVCAFGFALLLALVSQGCVTLNAPATEGPGAFHDGRGAGDEADLYACLSGSRWQWDGPNGEEVVFEPDGYVEHPGWSARGLVTRWEAIDRRTVLLEIERGRTQNLYAVLVFSDDVKAFSGFNFGGLRLLASRRRGVLELDEPRTTTATGEVSIPVQHVKTISVQGGGEPDGGWRWVTGEAWSWTNWHSGEPNDADNGHQDYLRFYSRIEGHWDDYAGMWELPFLVEFEPTSPEAASEPDRSGWCDLLQLLAPATDTVGGGRTLEEDFQPVYNPENGHWYALVEKALTWEWARYRAKNLVWRDMPGHLATLTTPAENDWVRANLKSGETGECWWLGGYQFGGGERPATGKEHLVLYYSFDENEGAEVSDLSGRGNHGDVHGAKWTSQGKVGGAYEFDGQAYIALANKRFLDGYADTTICAWINCHLPPGQGGQILGSGDFRGGIDPVSTRINTRMFEDFGLCDTVNNRKVESVGAVGIQPHSWQMLAITLESGGTHSSYRVYLDGNVVDSRELPGGFSIAYDKDMPTQIGSITGIQGWVGLIDELMIFDRALSESEIRQLYLSYSTELPR